MLLLPGCGYSGHTQDTGIILLFQSLTRGFRTQTLRQKPTNQQTQLFKLFPFDDIVGICLPDGKTLPSLRRDNVLELLL